MKILGICGAQGALLYKLRKHLIANVEPRAVLHTKKEEQWKLNFGEIPFTRVYDKDLYHNIDLIIGSPSCGHSSAFSYSRKKSLGKPREDPTLNLFIQSVLDIKPRGFIMENLPKLLELIPIKEWEALFNEYNLISLCHPVSIFGNSQVTRKRLLLIGVSKNRPGRLSKVDFTNIFTCRPKLKVCKELSKTIRNELNYSEDINKKLSMYHYSDKTKTSLTVSEVRKLWNREFRNENRWPMKGHKMKNLPGVYRNEPNKYPMTLRPSNRQFDLLGLPMGLEWYRIIMGFPKSYKIHYEADNPTYWLNKARTAYTKGATFEVGTWIYRLLKLYKAL